jgi:Uma2 family endonuclease
MRLEEFDDAHGREGYLYELSKGVVVVMDVPNPRHLARVMAIKKQLFAYEAANPGAIFSIASGSDCKILLPGAVSERHPDVAVYTTAPPAKDVWSNWVPPLVFEVISPGSEQRDLGDKPDEYLEFGVREYVVVDGEAGRIVAMTRTGAGWAVRELRAHESLASAVLPGFELNCGAILKA